MGPMCFDYGFGPFRWVCTSSLESDLYRSDEIAAEVLRMQLDSAPQWIHGQLLDNLHWIQNARHNLPIVGSKSRILYADADGRIAIARAFNQAIANGELRGPVVLGRDHHDVSGTGDPYAQRQPAASIGARRTNVLAGRHHGHQRDRQSVYPR